MKKYYPEISLTRKSVCIIRDNDLCVSCGACTHVCPNCNIEMKFSEYRGKWDAYVRNPELCVKCDGERFCLSVCPSYNVDYMALSESHLNNLLGRVEFVRNGFSTDSKVRFNASSGGFVKELCKDLIHRMAIDGVISITHDGGLEYTPKIIRDLASMPTSIYHNINYQNALLLLQKAAGKYLLIGLPCQITSIALLMKKKRFGFLKDRVYAMVSLICGHTFDQKNAMAFAHYNKYPMKEISYREKGRYRKTRLKGGSTDAVFDISNPRSPGEKISNMLFFDQFLPQLGCLYCVDHICYCADIVVGDAWQKKYSEDLEGTNIIICRTKKGKSILSEFKSFEFQNGHLSEIIESQGETYALGSIGEGMKSLKIKGNYFIPFRKRTGDPSVLKKYSFKLSDLVKIKFVKPLLRSKKFDLARFVYIVLYIIDYSKSTVSRIAKRRMR